MNPVYMGLDSASVFINEFLYDQIVRLCVVKLQKINFYSENLGSENVLSNILLCMFTIFVSLCIMRG